MDPTFRIQNSKRKTESNVPAVGRFSKFPSPTAAKTIRKDSTPSTQPSGNQKRPRTDESSESSNKRSATEAAQVAAKTVELQSPTIRSLKQKKVFKTSMDSPFSVKWPIVNEDSKKSVLNAISKLFLDNPALRKVFRPHNRVRKSATQPPEDPLSLDSGSVDAIQGVTELEKEELKRFTGLLKQASVVKNLFCMGINSVTRSLERNELQVVVIPRNSCPSIMVQHIPVMCGAKNVPCVPLPTSSIEFGSLFLMKSVLAFGIKKFDPALIPGEVCGALGRLVGVLQSTAVAVDAPWIDSVKGDNGVRLLGLHICQTAGFSEPNRKNARRNPATQSVSST